MQRSGLSAMDGAALIGVYSMLFYLPIYGALWWPSSRLTAAPVGELVFQASYQGVLMGFVSRFSLSRAIVILGATRAAAFISLVPVLGTLFGAIILHEMLSVIDGVAVISISLGVRFAAGGFPAPRRCSVESEGDGRRY
jgi:drug/metabolite transporter (DMT)-like permease